MTYLKKLIYIILFIIAILYAIILTGAAIHRNRLEHLTSLDVIDKDIIHSGKDQMAKTKVVIAGMTRDNANELPITIKHIEKTGSYFKDYRVIIFENDSADGTKEILQNWQQQNHKVKIISEDFGVIKRPSIAFMAKARNFYLQELESNPEYNEFDMVMILDLDMSFGWDMRGIFHSFAQHNWDGVCSNGIYRGGHMYDMFAFRNEEFNQSMANKADWTDILARGLRKYLVNVPLVPVRSCFGGLAFYKKATIAGCRYSSPTGDCEHIAFHDCISQKNHGQMYMNPSQIIRYANYPISLFKDAPSALFRYNLKINKFFHKLLKVISKNYHL